MRGPKHNSKHSSFWQAVVTNALIVALLHLTTGCDTMRDETMTGKLWDEGQKNYYAPAPHPNAALYRTADSRDVLVTYDELREANDAIHRRAYFLLPNLRRLEDNQKPKFVDPAKIVSLNLSPVPDAGRTNEMPQETIFVRWSDDGQEFRLLWGGKELGPYLLPLYVDRRSEARRTFLTPFTSGGDLLVALVYVGVIAAGVVGYAYASGRLR
jgi:hypothetical protein